MITLTRKQQIIMGHLKGESNRKIAARLHVSRDTVNKYVQEYNEKKEAFYAEHPEGDADEILQAFVEGPKYDTSSRQPVKVTEELRSEIAACLRSNEEKRATGRHKQQMRKKDIHSYLAKKGYGISYSTVKRLVNEMEERHEEAYIRQEYEPGDICEFDWGEVKLDIGSRGWEPYQMAVFTAAHSGVRYARLYRAQDTAAFQESHADFFAFCGGAFHTMVYDNMKVAVKKFVGPSEKEPTEALLGLSVYYGFQFRFCNIRRGNEKGHVERSVDVIRHEAFSAPDEDRFGTLEEANRHLLERCVARNGAKASDGTIPAEAFREERKRLLPPMPRFESCARKESKVDKYSTVTVSGNHYSVPDTLVGKRVQVRLYTGKVVIYHNEKVAATHVRSYEEHGWVIDIYHYLRTLERKPGALAGSTALLQSDAAVREIYETWYRDNAREFLLVLELIREKGPDTVREALGRLERLSPKDMSAEKLRVLCENAATRTAPVGVQEEDPLSRKARSTLSQYDLLARRMGGVAE